MILLESANRVLGEAVSAILLPPEPLLVTADAASDASAPDGAQTSSPSPPPSSSSSSVRTPVDIKLCDFDDVAYRVQLDASALDQLKVSLSMPCYAVIAPHGARAALEKSFPGMLAVEPEAQYDVTVCVLLSALPTFCSTAELVTRLSLLKATALGGVYERYFDALLASKPLTDSLGFAMRDDTKVYLVPKNDRLTIVYSINFTNKTDSAIARIFMQEFVEAKRRIGQAPPCTFSAHPPLELREFDLSDSNVSTTLGFLSFAVLRSHLEGDRAPKVIAAIASFRTYLLYHITCSKSYFHARMRARVVSLLKVLSRAKMDSSSAEKKTITGRTFVRS